MFSDFAAWWKSPFSASMSVPGWILFFGLVLVIGGFWKIIFSHLAEA